MAQFHYFQPMTILCFFLLLGEPEGNEGAELKVWNFHCIFLATHLGFLSPIEVLPCLPQENQENLKAGQGNR